MQKPTYKQQFDKLTRAYIEERVRPFQACACFIGNLLNSKSEWIYARTPKWEISSSAASLDKSNECILKEAGGLYTLEEIYTMERIFLERITVGRDRKQSPEENLFAAFSLALDKLKEIHLSKGEQIDDIPLFTQRKLKHETANV